MNFYMSLHPEIYPIRPNPPIAVFDENVFDENVFDENILDENISATREF